MRLYLVSPLALVALLAACGDKGEDADPDAACVVSEANGGSDQSVALGSTVNLSASGSAVCDVYKERGSAIYSWKFDRVPVDSRLNNGAFSVNGTDAAVNTSFVPDAVGDYVITLQITDPRGTSSDLLVVSVGGGNAAPVAWCAGDVTGTPGERVELDGTGSFDPEGAALTYSWSLATVPDCSSLSSTGLFNSDTATPSLNPDCDGIYLASLVVSDGQSWSEPDYCVVNVGTGNRLPEADAGASQALPFCTENPLQLDGWASYDLDNDPLTYQWSVVSVPSGSSVSNASLSDRSSVEPTLAWDVPGSYVLELQVHDGTIWSAPDQVTYIIAAASTNTAPVANGGSDQRVTAIGECSSTAYVWSCMDCPETWVVLDGAATSDPDGDPLTYRWTADSRQITWSNSASAITDMIIPPQASSFGVSSNWDITATLTASDCATSDSDTVLVKYTCTGEYTGE